MGFRAANVGDASSLAAISIEVWLGTYIREGVTGFFADFALAEFTTPKFKALLSDANEHFIVSEGPVGITGFIRITTKKEAPIAGCSDVEIATLYIQPRHHGKGLGQGLLSRGIAICQAAPWLMVNSENQKAIDFYLSKGFEKLGETHFKIQNNGYLNEVLGYKGSSI